MSNRFCICDLLDIFRSKYRKRNNTNSFLFRSESEKKIQLCNCLVRQTQPIYGRSSSILDCQLSFWKMAKIRSKTIFSKFLLVFLDTSSNALEHVGVSSICVNPSSRYNCRKMSPKRPIWGPPRVKIDEIHETYKSHNLHSKF